MPDRAFFAAQRRFAERWATVASIPVEEAYLECTTWYHLAAGLGRDFDAGHPRWQRLLAEMAVASDPDAVVHRWAGANEMPVTAGPVLDASWSPDDREVRLLFVGARCPAGDPLGEDQLGERQRELRELVRRAAAEHPQAWLRGKSWLYGLGAYRRIFPSVFLEGLQVEPPDLQFFAIWGQLLDRQWHTRPEVARELLARVDAARTTADLEVAFPMPMQVTRAPLTEVAEAL